MNELLENIDKIQTTELGIIRIKKNLEFESENVIKYCKNIIKVSDKIIKKGKNWYVYKKNIVLTINASSYGIITAHKNKKVCE